MDFELLDGYLLDNAPPKRKVVGMLEKQLARVPAAAPFLQGMRMLGARTPDLSFIALRLVLAGQPATDRAVLALKAASDAARKQDAGRENAVQQYYEVLASPPSGRNGE